MKKIFFSLFALSLFLLPALSANAQGYGLDATVSEIPAYSSQKSVTYDQNFLTGKVGDVIGLVLSFVGVIFLILIIYGGITWMTAAGNEQAVEKAKTIIIQATIGLVIIFAAYALVNFVGKQFISG
jgi:cbb3-type cytochrome oxidase subunit 3